MGKRRKREKDNPTGAGRNPGWFARTPKPAPTASMSPVEAIIRERHPSTQHAVVPPEEFISQCREEAGRLELWASEQPPLPTAESVLCALDEAGASLLMSERALVAAVRQQRPDIEPGLTPEEALLEWEAAGPSESDAAVLLEQTAEQLRTRADAVSLTKWASESL